MVTANEDKNTEYDQMVIFFVLCNVLMKVSFSDEDDKSCVNAPDIWSEWDCNNSNFDGDDDSDEFELDGLDFVIIADLFLFTNNCKVDMTEMEMVNNAANTRINSVQNINVDENRTVYDECCILSLYVYSCIIYIFSNLDQGR